MPFLGVSVLVMVTPGQDTALTIRNALTGGRRGGVRTALGVATGQVIWAVAAAAGVAAVLQASEPAFLALRIAGAGYLVYLGAHALWAAIRGGPPPAAAGPRRGAPFRQGLLSNLGNPKAVVFFTSLLPQFADSFATMAALGLLMAGMTAIWLSVYAAVVDRAGDFLRRSRIRRTLDAVTGIVLVALGVRIATER